MAKTHIAIVGGGMTATYMLKHIIEQGNKDIAVTIFEKNPKVGPGMAYSRRHVNKEHLANSGSQEIPDLEKPLHEWLRDKSDAWLEAHNIKREEITAGSIYPRVVLGSYFEDQFQQLVKNAKQRGIEVNVYDDTEVKDVIDDPDKNKVAVLAQTKGEGDRKEQFDKVVIATGHVWPEKGKIKGFYDSPWPIEKISRQLNHPVAVIGTSLSGVDTVLTLADKHGKFERDVNGKLQYKPDETADKFSITMFSRKGLLPDLRCHFEYPEHDIYRYVKAPEIEAHRKQNGGFVSIDFFFKKYKEAVQKVDPEFYERIKFHDLKSFINFVVRERQQKPPFDWLADEYAASQRSLSEKKPMHWKEILDDVTYSLSFYAKYLNAEDMLEFKRDLMPLASYVIAFMPLESAEKLMALHDAGKLDLVATGQEWSHSTNQGEEGATLRYRKDSKDVDQRFGTVVRATGQQEVSVDKFPFRSLADSGAVQPMSVVYSGAEKAEKEIAAAKGGEQPETTQKGDGDRYYFYPGGIAVDDSFRIKGKDGANPRIFDLAVPHLLGCYPYTQSLPFCNDASRIVMNAIMKEIQKPVVGEWTQRVNDNDAPSTQRQQGG